MEKTNNVYSLRLPPRIRQLLDEAAGKSVFTKDPSNPNRAGWLIALIKQHGRKELGEERYNQIMEEPAHQPSPQRKTAVRKAAGHATQKRFTTQVVRKQKLGAKSRKAAKAG